MRYEDILNLGSKKPRWRQLRVWAYVFVVLCGCQNQYIVQI